jgi:glutaredoxin
VIRVFGTTWCGDCKRAKKFLGEHRIPYEWTDIDANVEGQRVVIEANGGKRIIPTICFDDGAVLAEPSNADLARQLGIKTRPDNAYDLRRARSDGLTAALTARRPRRARGRPRKLGGQAGHHRTADNRPLPEGISGGVRRSPVAQCRRLGVELPAAQVAVGSQERYRQVRPRRGRGDPPRRAARAGRIDAREAR